MYCPRCGAQIPDGSTFCSSCGANLAQQQAPPAYQYNAPYGGAPYSSVAYRQKSTGLALLLAFLFPGAGHLYAGKVVKGIIFIAAFFGLAIISSLAWWYYFVPVTFMADWPFNSGLLVFTVIVSIVAFIIWIYQLIDAYTVTKRFNAELMATGREPW